MKEVNAPFLLLAPDHFQSQLQALDIILGVINEWSPSNTTDPISAFEWLRQLLPPGVKQSTELEKVHLPTYGLLPYGISSCR